MRTRDWVVLVVSASWGTIALDARADDCEVQGAAQGTAGSLGSSCVDVDNLWLRPGSSLFLASGATESTPAGEISFGVAVPFYIYPDLNTKTQKGKGPVQYGNVNFSGVAGLITIKAYFE